MQVENDTKRALMLQYPCSRGRAFVCKNIGDYVQSIATRQYIDKVDEYIEQEEANEYYPEDKRKARMIMNGWFQWRAENWPPSEYIEPLLISMHISPLKAKDLLTSEGIAFLKKNGPVGCRDYGTKNLLESVGVPAYFSACLTLTLGKKYLYPDEERRGIYFVDPYFEIPQLRQEKGNKVKYKVVFSWLGYFILHMRPICKLAKHTFFKEYSPTGFLDRDDKKYRPFYKAAVFYKMYSKKFDKQMLLDAEYITHWMDVNMSKDTNDDLLEIAENLIKKYASAKLLVTSRIHAALPALATRTPVIFVENEKITAENCDFNTPGRLGGLLEFFRTLQINAGGFDTKDSVLASIGKFTKNVTFQNKTEWERYAAELDAKCTEFMK